MSNSKYGQDERRMELVKTISSYLEKVGLLEFSFRGAAKVAGASPMTLVRYFTNRDGLLDELLEYSIKMYVQYLENSWPGNLNETPVETMRQLIADLDNELYDIESKKLWMELTLLAESPNAPEAMKIRYLNVYTLSKDYIVHLLQSQGLSEERAINVGTALHSFSNGIYRDYYTHKDKKIAQSSFDLMLNWLQDEIAKG